MGGSMAGHIASAGCKVCVYNRSIEKSQKWAKAFQEYDVSFKEQASEVAHDADFVISCVGKDVDLEEITIGPAGCFTSMREGTVFIDHTTTSSNIAVHIANKANNLNLNFLDAPVSGGNLGAKNGTLSVMCGGDDITFKKSKDIISLYSKNSILIGDSGCGQLAKMVNQICIVGLIQGLAEGINFGKKAGLDMNKVIDAIKDGAAGSWQMNNRSKTMINNEYNFGFAVDLMRKDLSILLNKGSEISADLPITKLVDDFYQDLQKLGRGNFDTTALLSRLEDL